MFREWEYNSRSLGVGNYVLRGDGFFISYNPRPGAGFSFFESDGGSDETAIVAKGDKGETEYYILNGDFRKEYEAVMDRGLAACLRVFEANRKECCSTWTSGDLCGDPNPNQ